MQLTAHKLSVEAMAHRDALDAFHGHAVSNPYPTFHPNHADWQSAFETHLAMLQAQEKKTC
jgi:hypothetical protein